MINRIFKELFRSRNIFWITC